MDLSSLAEFLGEKTTIGLAGLITSLLFGIGMILALGCASRMPVLAAKGNLRALLTGLTVAAIAQAALNGGTGWVPSTSG